MAIRRVSLDENGQQLDEQSFVQGTSRDGRHILFGPSGISDVGEPDTPRYADARLHLRSLLGVRHDEEVGDGHGH